MQVGAEDGARADAVPACVLDVAGRCLADRLGVRTQVLGQLQERNVHTRVYIPYGADWFRYWMRRHQGVDGTRASSSTC
jgi:proline dehydrogenase